MESKKDIGKFFRENLDQLDRTPSARVWEGIETDLKEKKKKRRAFFWFFLAAFVCGSITTLTLVNFNNSNDSNAVKENTNTVSSERNSGVKNSGNSNSNTNTDPNSGDHSKVNSNTDVNPVSTIAETENKNENENTATNASSQKKGSSVENASERKGKPTNSASVAATSSKNNTTGISGKKAGKSFRKNKNTPNAIAFGNQKNKQQKGSASGSKSKDPGTIKNNPSVATITEASEKTASSGLSSDSKKSDNSLVSEKNNETTKTDSLAKTEIALTENKETLPEKEKDSTAEQEEKPDFEIIVAPYYGYSYSGKVGGGNSLSSQYDVLSEGGKINQNYGILVRWMGTEKLGIQTGVGVVQAKRFIEVEKNGSFFSPNNNLELDAPMSSYNAMFPNDTKVKIHEEYQYIEVPLEAYYIWSENKFGVASSFGISLFFVSKNDIYLESESANKFRIGSSKNSAPQSFVANAKVNLFYNLSKRIQLDLYPEFQFQFMSHKDVSGFYPYYLSIKAGISYKL